MKAAAGYAFVRLQESDRFGQIPEDAEGPMLAGPVRDTVQDLLLRASRRCLQCA